MSLFRTRSTPRCYGELMAEAAAEGYDCPESHAEALRTRRELVRAEAKLRAAEEMADEFCSPLPVSPGVFGGSRAR